MVNRTFVGIACAVASMIASGCSAHQSDPYSGTLQAPSAAVGSTTGGRVSQVLVSEGDAVTSGQPLVRFDDVRQRGGLESATAKVAEARAALADLRAGARPEDLARAAALARQQRAQYEIASAGAPYRAASSADQVGQARAHTRDALATARDARIEAERMRSLYSTGDVSGAQRDAAVAADERARAQVAASAAALRAAQAQYGDAAGVTLPNTTAGALAGYQAAQAQYDALAAGPRPEQIHQAEAAVRAATGAFAEAQERLADGIVRAPAAGVVMALDLHPGDLVAPGASVATIDERADPFVRIYVPQSELGKFSVGAKLAVHSDALPGATFDGIVENIDARAQFTPQNVQTADDRASLSFGVKVRVSDPKRRLHGGTTVGVSVP